MSVLRAIIIDDEADSISLTQSILASIKSVEVVATCLSAVEGYESILRLQPDLLFLDVEMPDEDGFDLLRRFKGPKFKVIFVSGYGHYALRAIKFSAVDYILKPVDADELFEAVKKVEAIIGKNDDRIGHLNSLDKEAAHFNKVIVSSQKGFETIELSNVQSIESRPGNYAVFTLLDGSQTLATKALNYYEELFGKAAFFRIHRSILVNLSQVKGYDASSAEVVMSNGMRLEVAYRRRAAFNVVFKQMYLV